VIKFVFFVIVGIVFAKIEVLSFFLNSEHFHFSLCAKSIYSSFQVLVGA